MHGCRRCLGKELLLPSMALILQVERDTENPDIRIVHQIKNSLAPTAEDIHFSISAEKGFQWMECRPQLIEKQQQDIELRFDSEQQKAVYWIKHFLALIMCPEEDSASVEWARQKDENWVNKDITSLEFVENIFKLMNWNRECRYKVLGRVANSDQGLCMLFDLEEAIMFTPKPQEYTDPLTGEMKKKQIKFFPDVYKDRIGKSYNDYISGHQMNLFEDFIGYQGSAVLDEPEQKTDTISVPIPQCEESENIPLPDLSEQPENVQRPGSEVVEKGMLT